MDRRQIILQCACFRQVTLQSILVAIDVSSPQIVSLLMTHRAMCGPPLDAVDGWWGRPLQRLLEAPSKCPRESYRQLVRLMAEATVGCPSSNSSRSTTSTSGSSSDHRSSPAAVCCQRISATVSAKTTSGLQGVWVRKGWSLYDINHQS